MIEGFIDQLSRKTNNMFHFEFLWIKQSKNVYEIMFISLYEWGVY